jgi:hypothetical protein
MQQRQLRLGDILDDYCPRERRVTNHAVVAMVGEDVKQTRCTTCDCDHEFKHAKVPRQRRKTETPAALYAQVLANGPKRVTHEGSPATAETNGTNGCSSTDEAVSARSVEEPGDQPAPVVAAAPARVEMEEKPDQIVLPHAEAAAAVNTGAQDVEDEDGSRDEEDGPVHRPLIRASLPKHEGQPPPTRPIPEFTIRQPAGRPGRFRPRHQRGPGGPGGAGGQQFQGNRSNGGSHGGPPRGGMRPSGGRPPQGGVPARLARRNGPGRKRSK